MRDFMNKLGKISNIISTIFTIIMILCISYLKFLINGTYFDVLSFLVVVCMLINPIANLCRINKKIINNPIYHFLLVGLSIAVSVISIKSIIMYYNNYSVNVGNEATLYFYNRFIYILVGLVMIILLSFIMKKEKVKIVKDNSKMMFLIIAVSALSPLISNNNSLFIVISIGVSIFSIVMIFKISDLNTIYELQKLYIVLGILCILTSNMIGFVLFVHMFIQLDKFGLSV